MGPASRYCFLVVDMQQYLVASQTKQPNKHNSWHTGKVDRLDASLCEPSVCVGARLCSSAVVDLGRFHEVPH